MAAHTRIDPPVSGLFPVNLFSLHERLTIQQGVFVAPGQLTKSFNDNLRKFHVSNGDDRAIVRIVLDCSDHVLKDAFEDLRRMNITTTTLFPGLDGFARHLGHLLINREALGPVE